ncbi:MAG: prepilin-type N-terminal cleavage/methylation domain-containing protein [Elusimicrobiaceae bacterium]|nr:prepilin-type N-terminal cleavage/methylation domain-containing protein [Elusimicrobiaceae bacterium]
MKKGFTLMEILAVLLVIAVVASFAVPIIRSVRSEMRYQRAKTAALKIAEAMRSYYYNTKGYTITGSFGGGSDEKGGDVAQTYALAACVDEASSGVPASERGETIAQTSISVLFNCHYLDPKDFRDLPYTFTACNDSLDNCISANVCPGKGFVYAVGNAAAGQYLGKRILVKRDMTICEEE